MDKIIASLEEMKLINNEYEISNDSIEKLFSEINNVKVCVPVIGKFSSGKSALVNTLLKYSKGILKEDITPETSVPTEIIYSEDEDIITIFQDDDSYENISISDYRNCELDAKNVKFLRIYLRNNFLNKIPDVMIVDMPGFESGFEAHNKAIDNYLPKSLAYIVAFPADDMVVRSSVGNILKELCLNDMPICVVITKYDKKNDDFDKTLENMKASLKKYIGDRQVHYCITSSYTKDAEELEDFLFEIQEKSQNLLSNKYKKMLYPIFENTENYLITILNKSNMSESELDEQEEKLQKQLSSLDSKFSKEKENFDLEVSECIDNIKNDIEIAMEEEESTLINMVMNNQSINEHLNNVIRNTVTLSVKKHLISKVDKYIKKVSEYINSESIGDVHISFSFDTSQINKNMSSSIVAVIAGIIFGSSILGSIIAWILMKKNNDKKREEMKQKIRMKLRQEVFPHILKEVGNNIKNTITNQINSMNTSIENEIRIQRETLEKAMSDLREKINEEKTIKENLVINSKSNLEKIKELKLEMQ